MVPGPEVSHGAKVRVARRRRPVTVNIDTIMTGKCHRITRVPDGVGDVRRLGAFKIRAASTAPRTAPRRPARVSRGYRSSSPAEPSPQTTTTKGSRPRRIPGDALFSLIDLNPRHPRHPRHPPATDPPPGLPRRGRHPDATHSAHPPRVLLVLHRRRRRASAAPPRKCGHASSSLTSGITTYTPQYRNHVTQQDTTAHATDPATDLRPRRYVPPVHATSPSKRPAREAADPQTRAGTRRTRQRRRGTRTART